uniref:Uncharacterized protein n=1 Tax=Phaeomonas parva TaxID=124430 RepID=A0A7S1TVU8_9STRA|mmetsp:Transcript_20320/g.61682  ORF Transcript_20320/g.61682 Transcript_20320/m.61682 type:complete len:204 (+) Transcript_20320:147-758(+)
MARIALPLAVGLACLLRTAEGFKVAPTRMSAAKAPGAELRKQAKSALLGGAVALGCIGGLPAPEALAVSTTEVNAALERVREASNLDALSVALDELSDATGDGEAVLPAKTKREVVSTLKTKARYRGFDWDQDAVAAYSRIYFKMDPFYVVELRPWLQFAPFVGGALYLGTLFIQQRKPEWFTVAYLVAAGLFVLPVPILLNL